MAKQSYPLPLVGNIYLVPFGVVLEVVRLVREGFKKKKVKLGLLAEVRASEGGLRAQPCYQVFFYCFKMI